MSKCLYKSLPDMKLARSRNETFRLIRGETVVSDSLAAFAKGRLFYIKTFGCQANVRDEEIMSGYLEMAGFTKTDDPHKANIAIINTCAVRDNAEEKVYGEIGTFKDNHLRDSHFILAVCGCMMQEETLAVKIEKSYPYVNLIFGTHNLPDLLSLIDEAVAKSVNIVDIRSFPGAITENLPSARNDRYKALVNITYGCDKFCTYCIVPYTRGRERSRLPSDIVAECSSLVKNGCKEITLLGQNVNSYGKDFHDGTDFASILEAVAQTGIARLRFMTPYPSEFTDEMLTIMAKYPNIMKSIHLPVQSGSDAVLKRMGRRYTREQYLAVVAKTRVLMPECAISTDIIVGFPNETENEFEDTLSLCKEVVYDTAYTFIYSPRPGTPAAALVDNVSNTVKHERFNRLLKAVEDGVTMHAEKMVGKTYDILVDGLSKRNEDVLSGYTESGKLVNFVGPGYLEGCIVPVLITESHTFSLIGELVDDPLVSKAKDINLTLKNEEVIKEFLRLDRLIESDPSILRLRAAIKQAQRSMMSAESDDMLYESAKKAYLAAKKDYENNPLVANHEALHEDAEAVLAAVRNSLK